MGLLLASMYFYADLCALFDVYSIHYHNKLLPGENASALVVGHARVHTGEDHLDLPTIACQSNEPGTPCLEDGKQKARSKSLPTSQLDALESEDDPSEEYPPKNIPEQPPMRYAEISQTYRRYRKKVKPVEYQRPRYLSNESRDETDSDIDQESTSLLTAPEWTAADRLTTSVQIETQL